MSTSILGGGRLLITHLGLCFMIFLYQRIVNGSGCFEDLKRFAAIL